MNVPRAAHNHHVDLIWTVPILLLFRMRSYEVAHNIKDKSQSYYIHFALLSDLELFGGISSKRPGCLC